MSSSAFPALFIAGARGKNNCFVIFVSERTFSVQLCSMTIGDDNGIEFFAALSIEFLLHRRQDHVKFFLTGQRNESPGNLPLGMFVTFLDSRLEFGEQ